MPDDDALSAADSAPPDSSPAAPSAVKPCGEDPLKPLEALVLDEADRPLGDVVVELANGAGQVMRTKTRSDGGARFDGLKPGDRLRLGLPALDAAAWEPIDQAALDGESARAAAWQSPPASQPQPTEHAVKRGDCIASIAERYGYAPGPLWNDGANAKLKASRKNYNVLLEDEDVVALPPRRARTIDAAPGQRYRLRRKGTPELLDVRLLDNAGEPKKGRAYILKIERADGEPEPDREGKSDGDGIVKEPIPPNAVAAELTLTGAHPETYRLSLGCMAPESEVAGVQARLNNLGFRVGEVNGKLDGPTRAAIGRFQRAHGLDVTGKIDDDTRAKLKAEHRS